MLQISTQSWLKITIFNLAVVAVIGVLMRYKIGFEFPYFDQKQLQHGHSHFAFCGWISQTLMVLMVHYLKPQFDRDRVKLYNALLGANLLLAYGMLFSFIAQGYGIVSIVFSTLSVLLSFLFAVFYFKDLNRFKVDFSHGSWFKAALVFNVISAIGTFALAFMMATKTTSQYPYLASVYWYLHFQYNGWFMFASFGLFLNYINAKIPSFKLSNSVFWLFALSCIPTYGLSVLWLNLPLWIYAIVLVAAVAQTIAWLKFIAHLNNISFLKNPGVSHLSKLLFSLVGVAFTIKILLQLGSTIPAISELAFGFRPIVIAYLHLVLLAIISVFLLAYSFSNKLINTSRFSVIGILVFVCGVFMNEILLTLQGILSFSYTHLPHINELLFSVSIIMLSGLIILGANQLNSAAKH